MFGFLKRNKKDKNLKEFSFIWYKRLESKGSTYYTKPFRTKVKAKNYEEAKDKLTNFVLGKMELIIYPEGDFDKSDLNEFNSEFDKIKEHMDNLFKKHNFK